MERALTGEPPSHQPQQRKQDLPSKPLPEIEIAMIGAAGFYRHAKKIENEVFVTSLYEIERIIEEKTEGPYDPEEDEIRQLIPTKYYIFLDVFSRKESNTLLLY